MTSQATLPVVETFHSLQGEGHHSGRSAFFIRLAGCTVGCTWCDTKHSWPEAAHPQRHLGDLAQEAAEAERQGAAFTVITGGEPLHHNLDALASALRQATSHPLHLETSGIDPLSGRPDWVTLSPKPHRPPRQEILSRAGMGVGEGMGGAARSRVYTIRRVQNTTHRPKSPDATG